MAEKYHLKLRQQQAIAGQRRMPVILISGRLRQEDIGFEASMGYTVIL
jgi:hypothetical protein